MKIEKMIFATGNEGKMREVRMILGDLGAEILSLKEAGIQAEAEENGTTFEENLLQVLRYGQLYGSSNYDELNELFQKYSKSNEELSEVHQKYFDLADEKAPRKSDFNVHQHFLIVTNGLDQNTVDAIRYWKNNGLSIDAIIYWVFEIGSEHYIEFNMYSPIEGYLEYELHDIQYSQHHFQFCSYLAHH